jgi:invasion protein IalB
MRRTVLCLSLASIAAGQAYAQQRQPARPAPQPTQAQQQQQQQQPAEPQRPTRTETRSFDNWSVSCAEFEKPQTTRCSATLQVVPEKSNQVVFAWTIAFGDDKRLTGTLITPTGVQIAPGVELKLGKAGVRKVAFSACTPRQCVGVFPVDESLVKETMQTENAEAIIQAVDGRTIRFTFPIKGIDRAVAQLRR